MTQRRLPATFLLLLASPWAAAHPGHGQGMVHVHHTLSQALADWPAAVAALAIALGLLAGWWAWRRDQADQRLSQTLAQRGFEDAPGPRPPN